jgi:hypothetical protein
MSLARFPWSWIVRRAARSFGLTDPALLIARLRRFGQPSEHDMPLEIVRNAVLFHSRGLVNTRAIQNNLDWIWPYWIQRQFDPRDVSFLPRSANISHINLTHRNWTAVGLPDLAVYPLIDPRGLVTPLYDGWSIDAWLVPKRGPALIPSRVIHSARQTLDTSFQCVTTEVPADRLNLRSQVWADLEADEAFLKVRYIGSGARDTELVISVRPYNCEGIQFIDSIRVLPARSGWRINESQDIFFSEPADRSALSTYSEGDVVHNLADLHGESIECPVGMATGAACFTLGDAQQRIVEISVPLAAEARRLHGDNWRRTRWPQARAGLAELVVPDSRFNEVFQAACNTVLQLTANDVYPGPYTYRRFWFRDASLMLESLIQLGGAARARPHLDRFVTRQRRDGYFESQEGEWDSNGEVLWTLGRYLALTGDALPDAWHRSIMRATSWLAKKRIVDDGRPQGGLLPAGFSAEHFGPNDHYYWDVFWAVGGLRAVAPALARAHHHVDGDVCTQLAAAFFSSIERSIENYAIKRGKGAIPASPFRRMDSGAIGVLVADYPLQIYSPADPRILKTLRYFLAHHFVNGGFFQDMTHSGVNIYLTLAIAQSLLRAGDEGWERTVRQVQRDASPTGMWPEAIHPITFGGCIGDGQHGWAAAEWLRWTRNAFVREEQDTLIFGSGLFHEWLDAHEPMRFGPSPTPWGIVSVEVLPASNQRWKIRVDAHWRGSPPAMIAAIPGSPLQPFMGSEITVRREEQAA